MPKKIEFVVGVGALLFVGAAITCCVPQTVEDTKNTPAVAGNKWLSAGYDMQYFDFDGVRCFHRAQYESFDCVVLPTNKESK